MKLTNSDIRMYLFIMCAAVVAWASATPAMAGCDCSKDTAIPPFLSSGADPNILLMIDNSASMYEPMYSDTGASNTYCFDNSYGAGTTYVGYFDSSTWYHYDTSTGWFEVSSAPGAGGCTPNAGGEAYYSNDVCVQTTGSAIDSFKASGNILNWASASKYDIEKYILTGGKYNATDPSKKYLESEGRGCAGNLFIKQVPLSKSGETGTVYYLTLGVGTDEDLTDSVNTTLLSVFPITSSSFDPSSCEAAITAMTTPGGYNYGTVKGDIETCLNATSGGGQHSKQALIDSLHDCWYLNKFGAWPGGGAQGFNYVDWCSQQYATKDPRTIGRDDPAYICYGDSTTRSGTFPGDGYIGRCWNPGTGAGGCTDKTCNATTSLEDNEICQGGIVYYCTDWNSGKGVCKSSGQWVKRQVCTSGTNPGWLWDTSTKAGKDALDLCITAAREDFCGYINVPQVVDPSDLQMSTGVTWNIPAILIGSGAEGQLGDPVATYKVMVQKDTAPSGILQEFSSSVRIGAMAFNHDGSKSECSQPKPYVTYACGDSLNRDGAKLIEPIGIDSETPGHTDALVSAINNTPADAWTPLAEAMFEAIGYYTQNSSFRLNNDTADFPTNSPPITSWCQSNNVLFITDGQSTADLNPVMTAFADANGDVPADSDAACGDLYGSTYFDDLAYYGRQGDIFSGSTYSFSKPPQNINTLVVKTGGNASGLTGECSATTLMENAAAEGGPNALNPGVTDTVYNGQDPTSLSDSLHNAFRNVLQRAAAGSAASVISATRGGDGAVYQAIFWPSIDGPTIGGVKQPDVTWAGEVHSLLMNSDGQLYEDTDRDGKLTAADQRVVLFFDESTDPAETKACYGDVVNGVCSGTVKSLHDVNYLWSAAEWLAGISDADIDSNRSAYISNEKKRYIFTWNDLNNDGKVSSNEILPFSSATDWANLTVDSSRGSVARDFGIDPTGKTAAQINTEMNSLVNWIRGKDQAGLRPREVTKPADFNVTPSADGTVTWRLGDIVHSTPTSVARPAENYHTLYRDMTYADFVKQYKDRRNVIYFGGNDGMLHAVNGGFYNADQKAFCRTADCSASATAPALGAELWAFVPYNLQPQLKCLTDPDYQHRYYVDLKPRVFDVQIFNPNTDHPHGWGTILVAGMNLGGNTVDADKAGDTRKFTSAYDIFDITNPEKPPVLLGELTYDPTVDTHMGYTADVPAVVPMKSGAITKWYLVFGSGPIWLDANGNWVSDKAVEGVSNQIPKVAVFPLDLLTTASPTAPFRIPTTAPTGTAAGTYVLSGSGDGFVSDPITMDFDLDPDYRADAVYFGTVEGDWGNWSGKLYRIATNAKTQMTTPASWSQPAVMFNPNRPISAAPMVGWDGSNYWVYFGTGRFFSKTDKTDASSNAQESFYGLKEPVDCLTGDLTWGTVDPATVVNVSSIDVTEAVDANNSTLSCSGGGSSCLPGGVTNFQDLENDIAGTGCDSNHQPTGMGGWRLDFPDPRERNLGQAALLGGLLTFTTYQPFDDICRPEGEAYLYAVYYKTGTSWHEAVYKSPYGVKGTPGQVVSRLSIGRGLAKTPNIQTGTEEGAKAFAQTSTGAIVEIEQPNLPIKNAKTGRVYWRVQ
jgi:type IV pilus assembly protein PilY1